MAEQRVGLNWVQVVAGAGAAVASAVLLSTLGVAGTLIGAAAGSIAASVSAHYFSRGLDLSREQALALRRVGEAREDIERIATHPEGDAESHLEHADVALGRAEADLRTPTRISWKQVAVVALALFFGVMVTITAFELLTGKAVSSYTGGDDRDRRTTVPGMGTGDSQPPSPSTTNSPSPSETSTTTPTTTATTTPTAPTESPSNPQPTPSGSPTPSASPTAAEPTGTLAP